MSRTDWKAVLDRAVEIIRSYDTGVTLRQLFYRLVAEQTLPNTPNAYKTLSSTTAKARRDRTFPDLLDRTSRIEEPMWFDGMRDALDWLGDLYRHDRTDGQAWTIILGVEKAGMSAQLDAWFTEPLGIPHVALGGYASQTLCDHVRGYVSERGRPAVLIYAGDLDPTGDDIDRDFVARVRGFDEHVRVALNDEVQLREFSIPRNVLDPAVAAKLGRDSRAAAFQERHGFLDQYEVDALDPGDLRRLYDDAIANFWDMSIFEQVSAEEDAERTRLRRIADVA